MKKLATYLIIFTWTIVITTTIKVFANESGLYAIQMPVVCGTPDSVDRYINTHKFDAVGISLGRAGSKPDGEPVYLLTFYANPDNESLMTMDIPSGTERCILFHSFNTALLPEKPGT